MNIRLYVSYTVSFLLLIILHLKMNDGHYCCIQIASEPGNQSDCN